MQVARSKVHYFLSGLLVAAIALLSVGVTASPASAATVSATVNCTNPTNLTAAVGDTIQATFVNCGAYNLYGGNGNGMFLNPTPEYQNSNTALWGAGSTGWSAGSRTWNLKFPADNFRVDFVLVGSANNGSVLIGPSSNLMFDSTKSPIFWWRMATVSAPAVTPSLSPSNQSVEASFGTPITPTSAFSTAGLVEPITYRSTVALPAGISIDANTGAVSGTIAEGTPFLASYTIRAIDANLQVASSSLSFNATSPSAAISPSTQTLSGTVGTVLTGTTAFSATGFSGTVSYSVSPSLPNGLTLNSGTGEITGTPLVAATGEFTVTASDGTKQATATVAISIAGGTVDSEGLSAQANGTSSGTPLIALDFRGPVGRVAEGIPVEIAGTGLPVGTVYDLKVASPQVVLASGVANGGGIFSGTFGLPALPPGTHTLTLTATLESGQSLVLTKSFEIGADGSIVAIADTMIGSTFTAVAKERLAYTGLQASPLPWLATFWVLLGLLFVAYSLRARTIVLEGDVVADRTPWEILATPIQVPGIDYTPGSRSDSAPQAQSLSQTLHELDIALSRLLVRKMDRFGRAYTRG